MIIIINIVIVTNYILNPLWNRLYSVGSLVRLHLLTRSLLLFGRNCIAELVMWLWRHHQSASASVRPRSVSCGWLQSTAPSRNYIQHYCGWDNVQVDTGWELGEFAAWMGWYGIQW